MQYYRVERSIANGESANEKVVNKQVVNEQEPNKQAVVLVSQSTLEHTSVLLTPIAESEAMGAEVVLYVLPEQKSAELGKVNFEKVEFARGKSIYCINHPAYFAGYAESLWCLDTLQMDNLFCDLQEIPAWLLQKAQDGTVCGVDSEATIPIAIEQVALHEVQSKYKKRVHIIAIGDVGGTLLIGLTLLGGDVIDRIGIYDFNDALCSRWEHEINQVAYPWQYDALPSVEVISKAQLFDCDVFVFCASKSVPTVGSAVEDVRMAQLEANTEIIAQYGRLARKANFQGLFAVVSDPVDLLCQRVYAISNRDESGNWDGMGLRPEQIQGYGLGVMNSRAAYYAKKEERFAKFLTEGRVYGPHGANLVVADSIVQYDHACSMELTQKTIAANLEIRDLGYKPYIAPALSSAAISILLTLRGEWHYSANYLGGIYMGCKNRTTAYGLELEHVPLPTLLLERLQHVQKELLAFQI